MSIDVKINVASLLRISIQIDGRRCRNVAFIDVESVGRSYGAEILVRKHLQIVFLLFVVAVEIGGRASR